MFEKIHVEIVYDWEFDHDLQDVFSFYSTFGSDSSNNKKPLQLEFGIRSDQKCMQIKAMFWPTFPAGWSPPKGSDWGREILPQNDSPKHSG